MILTAFRWFGVFAIWRYLKRNEVIILCLHGVMDDEIKTDWKPLRPQYARKDLDSALELLKKHYSFVSMADAVEMISGKKPIKQNAMVLTFDDGYLNNLRHALPILRKHGVPATMYIAVGHVERREPFWFDRLDYALQHAGVAGRKVRINGKDIEIDNSSREALATSYSRIRAVAKSAGRNDLEMLKELADLSEMLERESGKRLADIFENDDWSSILNWQQLAELSQDSLIEIGSHTINHIRLAEVNEERVMKELRDSMQILSEKTGVPCEHFCYPNGSFNGDTARCVRESGYRSAVTTVPGSNPCGTNVMQLKRIHLPDKPDSNSVMYVASGLAYAMADWRN